MLSLKLRLIFPNDFGIHAALSRMGSEHQIVTHIRRTEVIEDSVWMRLEMNGKPDNVEDAIEHLGWIGVSVAPIEGDIVN